MNLNYSEIQINFLNVMLSLQTNNLNSLLLHYLNKNLVSFETHLKLGTKVNLRLRNRTLLSLKSYFLISN